ncbi:MFS transporter [Veronia pacifica]|uniref:MFS transporter n=1 Tax=Veronia pacifica TaxID=1080227 RepID=UPI001C300BCF|nr:MFS transporter [Veronia pacifica]
MLQRKPLWQAFISLSIANLFSKLGNVVSEIAIPLFVYQMTESSMVTAGVAITAQLSNIIVGVFSGPLIDRFSARKVSVICDAINALAILLIPLFYSLEILDVTLLAGLVMLSKFIDVPGETAKAVLLPALISRDSLPRERVNGITAGLDNIADLAGPSLVGLLLAITGTLYVLVVDAISFLVSALIIGLLLRKYGVKDNIATEKTNRQIYGRGWH